MTSLVSIRIDDNLLNTMRSHAQQLKLSQTEYIRKAIMLLNKEIEKEERKERLKKASLLVRKKSMKVNKEFSEIEHDPEA